MFLRLLGRSLCYQGEHWLSSSSDIDVMLNVVDAQAQPKIYEVICSPFSSCPPHVTVYHCTKSYCMKGGLVASVSIQNVSRHVEG